MTAVIIEPGDFVRDPLDGDTLRHVEYVEGPTVHMSDGGVMGLDEIKEVLLPSEVG